MAADAGSGRVLVVEDDVAIGADLVAALAGAGYEVRWAQTAEAARSRLVEGAADLVLLDLGLPDADGVDVCAELRANDPDVVIVVVTARSDESDAVRALDAGADDFVSKPFRVSELLARLRAQLRRGVGADAAELRVGGLVVNEHARRASVRGVDLALRPKELELLAALLREAGTAVRREQLIDTVWDENWTGSTKTLDVHVASLRRKLSDAGESWGRISTLRGYGYRYELD